MAGFNHTDHLELIIPHPGSCYFSDHLARRLAVNVKADLFVLDSFDLMSLAQQTFHRHPASLLPLISAQDMDSNAMLTVKPLAETDKEEEEREGEKEEDKEDEKEDSNSIDVSDLLGMEKEKTDKVTVSLLNQVSQKYTQMFKNALTNKESKIIYLRDYAVMQDAFSRLMLKSLVSAVEDLKQKGHSLMFLTSHHTSIKEYFAPILTHMRTTTLLPPNDSWSAWKEKMQEDAKRRTAEMNAKGFVTLCTLKHALEVPQEDWINDLAQTEGMSDALWTLQDADRRAAVAIGYALEKGKTKLALEDLVTAHQIVSETSKSSKKSLKKWSKNIDISSIKQTANKYERKLLPRIVNPDNIQGSFKDIRAPASTIDTLQSLISLPLTHPDLFQTGILKKNFVPGVLLFGPPGTGKTMLAKAVAKESGSRMLDIQASDIYDMYVGQGEKNVRAIFSLARKLSPCVIFIDEVDSLMSKRGSDHSSKSHREIINQFMVEWDGLSSQNQGVIVMAATNRPFDLDDAVMRRMPRRILVDLPTEQDRLEIFNILMRDEQHEVLLPELAKTTQHYSGSDLKNVCVTAALKSVQEQIKTGKPVPLNMEHFKEALKMVPPSSSEEMGSLVEIRKWDRQFGDGKKKRKANIGFS
ncbi:P-loop containing nucleoside triphosphate hydrolase protein [Sporodiniella umbellata]|nr:P-loop containing nucleoside triphosphate hydrolase protein [Sporodiniella umbellata]